MANSSQKQAQKQQAAANRTNLIVIVLASLWQLYAKPGLWSFVFFSILNAWCYSKISSSVEQRMDVSTYSYLYDVLYLNIVVMFLHPFAGWAWYLYVLAFVLVVYHWYKLCKPARDMLSNMAAAAGQQQLGGMDPEQLAQLQAQAQAEAQAGQTPVGRKGRK